MGEEWGRDGLGGGKEGGWRKWDGGKEGSGDRHD